MMSNDHYNGNSQIYFIKIKSVAEAAEKFAMIWTLECECKRAVNILSGGPRVTKAECCPKPSIDIKISLTFHFHCEEGRIFLSPPVRPMSSRSNQDNKTALNDEGALIAISIAPRVTPRYGLFAVDLIFS